MKRSLLLTVVMLSSLCGIAQRVDLDRFSFTTSYRELPTNRLDSSWRTYSVVLEAGPVMKLNVSAEELERMVIIEGWKQVSFGGHVQVRIRLEDVVMEQNEVVPIDKVLRDKNGKEIGKETTYQVKTTYSFVARLRLLDPNGSLIQQRELQTRDQKLTHITSEFKTEGEAKTFVRYGTMQLLNDLNKRTAYSVTGGLGNELTRAYGFPIRQAGDYLWILNNRKHPEFEAQQKAWIDFQQAISNADAERPIIEARKSMQPVIAYYAKVKKQYASDDKNSRKLRYGACYNLSKIYFYLDMPDEALREGGELKITGYDQKDGDRLQAQATWLKQQMRQARMDTRHFYLPVDNLRAPETITRNDDIWQ
jgi:hypothetical protein